jgi:hypothetical protein
MFNFVSRFLGKSRGSRVAGGRVRSSRPVLESLEDRYVLSTISAVPVAGSPGEAFTVGSDHSLKMYQSALSPVTLSPAGTILSVSAGRLDDVYAVGSDHSLWRWTPSQPGNHWQILSPAGTISEQIFATANDGEVYVVPMDHSVWRHTTSGWGLGPLPGLGANTSLDVSVDHVGDVFVLGIDQSLMEESGGMAPVTLSGAGTILQISAGFSGDVFVVASDHSLWHHDSIWHELSGAGTIESISAGFVDDEVYAVPTDHSLWHYKSTLPGNHWEPLSIPGSITDAISADQSGDVFAVPTDNSLWDHTAMGWKQWDAPNTTL